MSQVLTTQWETSDLRDVKILTVCIAMLLAVAGCASDDNFEGVAPPGFAQQSRPDWVTALLDAQASDDRSGPGTSRVAELSGQALFVSRIAVANGDRDFLMVDKLRGLIFLFKNGQPVFSDAALTGASTADRVPPALLAKTFSQPVDDSEKITPAGRFTVSRQYDKLYGTTFDIGEVQGKDWSLAIHPVFLGLPYEHRLERLKSPTAQDNHVTYGCINISSAAIRTLTRFLPADRTTPLYVLPLDEKLTSSFFAARRNDGNKPLSSRPAG